MAVIRLVGKSSMRLLDTVRSLAAIASPIALTAILAWIPATPAAASARPHANAAHTVNGTATGHLHLLKAEGSTLIEEGPVTGALAGSIHADFRTGAVFGGRFTIRTRRGSISGTGTATPHGSGRYQSFGGAFQATSGSGLYVHVSGRARLYGTFDRRTDSLVVQTAGSFTY